MAIKTITNRDYRRTLLWLNGLSPPYENDLLPSPQQRSGVGWVNGMVQRLSFVQVDPIVAVEKAHHQILFSRNRRFRQQDLKKALEEDRSLFEGWAHDAAILPVTLYPYWKHYFEREKDYQAHPGYRRYFAPLTEELKENALRQIKACGPMRPAQFGREKAKYEMFDDRYPVPTLAKLTLEYLWRIGTLAVCRRQGNQKVYDLAERVIPGEYYQQSVSRSDYVDWVCRNALLRLGAATSSQVAGFYHAVSSQEAARWCEKNTGKDIAQVQIGHADGKTRSAPLFAVAGLVDLMSRMPHPQRRLRLLSPFDPLIHDRQRTARAFGFDYAIEIWVPPKKRKYGYYVLPILEGERFTGRIDTKVDRKKEQMTVMGLWWEKGVEATSRRMNQLEGQVVELAKFAGASSVVYSKGFLGRQ